MPSYLVAPNGGWQPLTALEARFPETVFVYATSSLPRGTAGDTGRDLVMERFNSDARAYALEHDRPLLDVADILSHDYDGRPCFDTRDGIEYCQTPERCENLPDDGVAIPAICQHYTTERFGGHLGSVSGGALRMAQAMWLLLARLADDGTTSPPTASRTAASATPSPVGASPTPTPPQAAPAALLPAAFR
jgi:hypothetical protein